MADSKVFRIRDGVTIANIGRMVEGFSQYGHSQGRFDILPKNWKLLKAFAIFLLTACLLTGCGGDDKYVSLVKNGSMDMAPNVKIGKAFDDFFGNPQWKSFVSTNDERIVEFSGNCTFADKPAHCKIQFVIQSDNRFQWKATTLNEVNMPWFLTEGLLKKALGV